MNTFTTELKRLRVYHNAETQGEVFIDFRDVPSKTIEKAITKAARDAGLTVKLADKGVFFIG